MTSTPPLLVLAQGRKPRPRKAILPAPVENRLHLDVAELLRKHARPDWLWFHVPNGEKRDYVTACRLKAMGVRPGIADFVLLGPDGLGRFLELKRKGEHLSEAQEGVQSWAVAHGVAYAIAHSIDEVLTAFSVWDCLRIKIAGSRP